MWPSAPKLVLDPDYSAEQRAMENAMAKETSGVRDISPHRDTAAETSARLQEVREEQKETVLPDNE